MIFLHLYHLQTKWQLVASVGRHCPAKYPVLHRIIPLNLHPNGRAIRMGRSRGSSRYSSNPSPTDFYVHKNIARCLFSRSKHFEHLEKHLPLQGLASSPKSGSLMNLRCMCPQSGAYAVQPLNPKFICRKKETRPGEIPNLIRRCSATPSVSTRRNTTVSSPCSRSRAFTPSRSS